MSEILSSWDKISASKSWCFLVKFWTEARSFPESSEKIIKQAQLYEQNVYNQTGNEKVADKINALTGEYNRIGALYNDTLATK